MEVQFLSLLRRVTKVGATEVRAATVREALVELTGRYGPALTAELFDARGEVRPYYSLLVNGRNVEFLGGLETRLSETDVLTIIPPAAGG